MYFIAWRPNSGSVYLNYKEGRNDMDSSEFLCWQKLFPVQTIDKIASPFVITLSMIMIASIF